jgi:hypothetical protein
MSNWIWVRQRAGASLAAVLAVFGTGCSSMPDVTVGYYEARGSATFTVTQTATCASGDIPILTTAVSSSPVYSSDTKRRHSVNLAKLDSWAGKANAGFDFYADGRLKGVNATGTGQAGDALKALVAVAATMVKAKKAATPNPTGCTLLRQIVGADKTLSIVHKGFTDFTSDKIEFRQYNVTKTDYDNLKPVFGAVTGSFGLETPQPQNAGSPAKDDLKLTLVEPAIATVTIMVGAESWQFHVFVPQLGSRYELPLKKAPWFGVNDFELALDESGKVTKLRYSGGGDAGAVLGVIKDAQGAFAGKSTAEKAADVKAEADLIYAQQRLVMCQADRTKCPSQ